MKKYLFSLFLVALSVGMSFTVIAFADDDVLTQQINSIIYGRSNVDQEKGIKQLQEELPQCETIFCTDRITHLIIVKQAAVIDLQRDYIYNVRLKSK